MGSELELALQKQSWSSSSRHVAPAGARWLGGRVKTQSPVTQGEQPLSHCPEQLGANLQRGDLHPLLCRAQGGAAKDESQGHDVQAGSRLVGASALP